MLKTLSIAVIALGLAASGTAFGQQWTRSTTTSPNPEMKNTYNPNTSEQQKAKDERKQQTMGSTNSTAGSQPAAPSTGSKTSEQVEKQK